MVAPPVEKKPDPAVVWSELLGKASAHLQADELDETEQLIDELANVYEDPNSSSEQQQSELDDLKKQLVKRRNALKAQQREENLAEAKELMNLGKYTEATEKLNKVTAYSPTAEQREVVRVSRATSPSKWSNTMLARISQAARDGDSAVGSESASTVA